MSKVSFHRRPVEPTAEAELIDLHARILRRLNAKRNGLYVFPDRKSRLVIIKWRVRIEQFIETADVTYVTDFIPSDVSPTRWITCSIRSN